MPPRKKLKTQKGQKTLTTFGYEGRDSMNSNADDRHVESEGEVVVVQEEIVVHDKDDF